MGYLTGCILSADIAARLANSGARKPVDLRAVGSGNPGGANAMANLGPGWGVAVILGDIAKGGLAAQAGRIIAGNAGAYFAATAAVAGHCFPAFSNFRGGKGVGTSAGTTLVCFPAFIPIDVALVAGSFAWSKHAGKATAATCQGVGLYEYISLVRSRHNPSSSGEQTLLHSFHSVNNATCWKVRCLYIFY